MSQARRIAAVAIAAFAVIAVLVVHALPASVSSTVTSVPIAISREVIAGDGDGCDAPHEDHADRGETVRTTMSSMFVVAT